MQKKWRIKIFFPLLYYSIPIRANCAVWFCFLSTCRAVAEKEKSTCHPFYNMQSIKTVTCFSASSLLWNLILPVRLRVRTFLWSSRDAIKHHAKSLWAHLVSPMLHIYFFFSLELYYDRGNHHEFVSLVKDLARPGEITQSQTFDFEFTHVEKPYESYTGQNVKLR